MAAPGPVGSRIDRYQLEQLLGVGGFGNVYRARHVHTDAKVALKLLKKQLGADHEMLERFLREAKAAASVGNEHIVQVLDANVASEGQAFIAFELLDGWDLKEFALRNGPIPPTRLVPIAMQALEGLAAAHAKGIVHRDIKPANVFVVEKTQPDGSQADFVKLLDFGISKMHTESPTGLTTTGMAMGTPSYMAPEQFFDAKHVDARADLYSLAVILFELLGSRLPYQADSYAEVVVKVRTEQPPKLASLNPHLPAALCAAIDRGLAKEREQRFANAREMSEALRDAMGLPRVATRPPMPAAGGLDMTAAPAQATPNVIASPSLVREAKQAPLAQTPTPVVAPGPVGLTPPPAQANLGPALTPGVVQGQTAPGQVPATKPMNKWIWVVLGVFAFFFGCCFFTLVLGNMFGAHDVPPSLFLHTEGGPGC